MSDLAEFVAAAKVHGCRPHLQPDGRSGTSRCPVPGHGKGRGDRSPSLSFQEREDGGLLLHCFAGCAVQDIVAALGLSMADLSPRADDQAYQPPRRVVWSGSPGGSGRPSPNLAPALDRYRADLDEAKLGRLAKQLGLSVASLQALEIGWDAKRQAWAFPMRDVELRLTGFRLRLRSGKKLTLKGTREGLFIPTGLRVVDRLFITEGPTDCAALLDHGFVAVGRPSCSGGTAHLQRLVRARHAGEVVLVADADEPGQRGAEALAGALLNLAAVRVVTPPFGDVREWITRRGGSGAELLSLVEATPLRRLDVRLRLALAPEAGS